MDIIEYLRSCGGVARSGQLLDAGFGRRELLRLTGLGATQPRRGIFVLPECWRAAGEVCAGRCAILPRLRGGLPKVTGQERTPRNNYRLAAGTRTQSTSTGLSVGLTQVWGSRPGKVTVSPVPRSYSSLVRMSLMEPLITCSTSTSQSTA